MLQLSPDPGSPTVVRGAPERLIGMLKDAPGPPRETELRPLLPKLKRRGPKRALRRKRKGMGPHRLRSQGVGRSCCFRLPWR
jgi:hypothetical protein